LNLLPLKRGSGRAAAMNDIPTTILLVEDDAADARLIQEALTGAGGSRFHIEWVTRLSEALERLRKEEIEVILLDLTLPDAWRYSTGYSRRRRMR
jgi:CheY-like chemotaxis protein